MAQLALNKFQTVTLDITTSDQTPYTAPTGYTSIVLYAHVTNVSSTAATFTMSHVRSSTTTEIIKDASVPPADAYVPLDGKLVLETSDSVKISASANSKLKLILSILETAN
tara:strand:- start:848 stop:1180 length:333 start_codon:yes stop_codon:yes gene_type:complete